LNCCTSTADLWSNPGETVLTPFCGVGSEVAGAVLNGRKGVGVELKSSYFRQSVRNLKETVEKMARGDYLDEEELPYEMAEEMDE
jgi:DNA modification methylase